MAALAEAVDDLKIANEPRADVANHVRFLRMHLRMLPQPYLSLDTSRMTALYFCVVGLDILGELENELKADERAAMIDWIYGLQVDDGGHGGRGERRRKLERGRHACGRIITLAQAPGPNPNPSPWP